MVEKVTLKENQNEVGGLKVREGKCVLKMELIAESHRCNTLILRRALISLAPS